MSSPETNFTAAERALRAFLELSSAPPAPGAGIPEDSSPLLKRLWFCWNRMRIGFDWLLATRCKRLRPRQRLLLEWAMTECYALSGLPAHACVDLAVAHAKSQYGREEAGFINAVLRGLLRDAPDRPALLPLLSAAPESARLQLPEELCRRWRVAHGQQWLEEQAALLQEPAAVTARRRGSLAALPSPLHFEAAAALLQESSESFDPSEFYMQDASTLLAPSLLDPRPGEMLADLCAAPGGKSVAIAERLGGTGHLYSFDSSERRLPRLRENLAAFANIEVGVMDASQPTLPAESLDGCLLDVPCSNTGVIRRRPDVRRNFSLGGLQKLCKTQREILSGASSLVRPGGRLVYSTCSIEDDENTLQVAAFLTRHPEYELISERQLYPSEGHDGAYAALLRRK